MFSGQVLDKNIFEIMKKKKTLEWKQALSSTGVLLHTSFTLEGLMREPENLEGESAGECDLGLSNELST